MPALMPMMRARGSAMPTSLAARPKLTIAKVRAKRRPA
jgi:hypothetical protein